MKRFLWDNQFAACASDQPAWECWPPTKETLSMHETMLSLWGMPIGEIFDLEGLSKMCKETGRYTFFFTSWPLNVYVRKRVTIAIFSPEVLQPRRRRKSTERCGKYNRTYSMVILLMFLVKAIL